ncbi:MAG TPA: polysaccharide lyase family 8 super-sandwich domain-containing protein, partial [Saprospiraceae bacterium]|nr:polysaccharide lyase family 8 super-sandwich domain-containing protein [Saprospiraceae bacterium]
LGCGIHNLKPELGSDIRTTIDQSLVKGTVYQGKEMQMNDSPPILLKPQDSIGDEKIQVENNGFVYLIIPEQTPGEVWMQQERRTTRWDALNILNRDVKDKSTHADIFQLWINHGPVPTHDRYGYMVYLGSGEMPEIPRVLMNTTRIQAMASKDTSFIQAIFYTTDTLYYDERLFHVSAPCAFSAMVGESRIEITVSDAQMNFSLDSIVVTTNLPLKDAKTVGKCYQVSIALPAGIYRGKQESQSFKIE